MENQCGASDMPQSTAAKVVVRDRRTRPTAETAAQPRRAAGVRPAVLLARPGAEPPGEQPPDREVEDGAGGEEGHVEVGGLLLQQLVGGDDLGLRPGVDRGRAEDDRDEEQRHHGERARRRLVEAAGHEAPEAAGQVVQHGEAEAAHADADPEEEAEEVRAEELRRGRGRSRRRGRGGRARPRARPVFSSRSRTALRRRESAFGAFMGGAPAPAPRRGSRRARGACPPARRRRARTGCTAACGRRPRSPSGPRASPGPSSRTWRRSRS